MNALPTPQSQIESLQRFHASEMERQDQAVKALSERVKMQGERLACELPACAAIRYQGDVIIAGKRHADCLKAAMLCDLDKIGSTQGFMTTFGRFIGRREALALRKAARLASADAGGYRGDILFSEDLY